MMSNDDMKAVAQRLEELIAENARLRRIIGDAYDPSDFGPDGEPLRIDREWLLSVGCEPTHPGTQHCYMIRSTSVELFINDGYFTREYIRIGGVVCPNIPFERWSLRRLVTALGGKLAGTETPHDPD